MAAEKASAGSYAEGEKLYAEAMDLFVNQRDWAGARDRLIKLVETFPHEQELQEMVDRARMHLRVCDRKLDPPNWTPSSGEEWLLEGVMLGNEGRYEDALNAFEKALDADADRAKVHYSRAAAFALSERDEEALDALRAAIEADPEFRGYALGDPDFQRLREHAGFVSLVEPTEEAPREG
jgi:tetratricopeptide (TPR) repeat protein